MDIIQISKDILIRLTEMDYERKGGNSKQRLIFPNKFPSEIKSKDISDHTLLQYTRISEQELRFLFVEEFLKVPNYFYSVETPTEFKYKLGESFGSITCGIGRSASIDMSIYKRDDYKKYSRLLNIEFKNQNSTKFSIGKDVLKLIHEKQNGTFIILLKNTDKGTLINQGETGVLDKLYKAFEKFKAYWQGDNKIIQLIILSLEEKKDGKGTPFLIHHKINEKDNLSDVFSIAGRLLDVNELKSNGWEIEKIDKICVQIIDELGIVTEEKESNGK